MVSNVIVAVFGSSATTPDHPDWRLGQDVGRLLAEAGLSVTNGGYGGLMEAVSHGASAAGGRGHRGSCRPELFPGRSGANPYVSETRVAATLTERIHVMDDLASAFIALPGSIGTMTELLIALNDAAIAPLRQQAARPVIATRRPWKAQLTGTAVPDGLVTYVDAAEEITNKTLAGLGMA